METIIAIAIVTMLIGKGAGVMATDIAYAARGKTSPRMRLKQERLKAAAANGGRPVRYGFGGYMADLIDDTWRNARAKRAAGTGAPKQRGPLRRYGGQLWADGWDTMGRKHDRKRHARLVKAGLASEDEPVGRDGVGDAFDSTPREAGPPPGHPHSEGDFRTDFRADFTEDDLRRYGIWAKSRLPEDRHDEVDDWLDNTSADAPCGMDQVTDLHDDLHRWLIRQHPRRTALENQNDLGDDIAPSTPPDIAPPADVIPINRNQQQNRILNPREDTTMAEAELTGLEGTLIWARDNVDEAQSMKNDLDLAKASLEAGGVTGNAIDLIGQLSDFYDAIVTASKQLEDELSKQTVVADAYQAVDGAGTRDFVKN